MSNAVVSLAAPSGIKDQVVRAIKAALTTAIGVLGTNLSGYTSVPALRAAAIAGAGTGFTVLLNLVLTWLNSPE